MSSQGLLVINVDELYTDTIFRRWIPQRLAAAQLSLNIETQGEVVGKSHAMNQNSWMTASMDHQHRFSMSFVPRNRTAGANDV